MSGPVQLAYAVDDVRKAAAGWAPVGVGPFFVDEHADLAAARVRGAHASFDCSSAYGWWGGVMFELICQHDAGTAPVVGTSGVHHVGHFVEDLEVASASLVAGGHQEVLWGRMSAGQAFAMHDGGPARGHLIEIVEQTDEVRRFYDMVRDASIGWNGEDPVRTL